MTEDRGLKDKVIIISGGTGDIGGATGRKLASFGTRVIVWGRRDMEYGNAYAKEVGAVEYGRVDQGNPTQIHEGVADVARRFGRLDVVIGNAVHVALGRLLDRTAADWEESLRVNVIDYVMLAQAAIKIMLKQAPDAGGIRGKVLFTSSWVGKYPYPGSIDYCAAKAALDHLVRLVAQEYAAQGMRVNGLSPGILKAGSTRRVYESNPETMEAMVAHIPVGELGTPEQVADAYVYLCSPESNYMTGHILFVDGGCSLTKRA